MRSPRLPYEWVGAILVGGSGKLRGDADYGVPLLNGFGDAELVVDLSDEPVLGREERFRWASRALAAGLPYLGADFRFDPPSNGLWDPDVPSIAVIGAGERVGRAAVAAHLASLLARDRDVGSWRWAAAGRASPKLVERRPTVGRPRRPLADGPPRRLRSFQARGDHRPADDRLPPSGRRSRRPGLRLQCGRGARLAARAGPTSLFATRTAPRSRPSPSTGVLSSSARTTISTRIRTPAAASSPTSSSSGRLRGGGAISARIERRPPEPIEVRIAVFTAGAGGTDHLPAEVVHVSHSLGNRAALAAELEHVDADTYLIELKAAAIDVVAEHALAHGRRVVLATNDVIVSPGLDEALRALAPEAVGA